MQPGRTRRRDVAIGAYIVHGAKQDTTNQFEHPTGTLHAVAQPAGPITSAAEGYELPVAVDVNDAAGDTVFRARIAMWVSPRRGT